MKILNFDESTLKQTSQEWNESGISNGFDQEQLELNTQFFELILNDETYGEFWQRPSMRTHVGVQDSESGDTCVIVEVGFHKRGRETTLKIFDIYTSPSLENLPETDYDEKYLKYLIFVVTSFLERMESSGSVTKIYARTDISKDFLNQLEAVASSIKSELDDAQLSVEFEGKRWLAFRKH